MKMKITKEKFGELEGNTIFLHHIVNKHHMQIDIMDYGATTTSILIPNKKGGRDNIVCGFNQFDSYFSKEFKANAPYFGALVGRYSATIAGGSFSLDGIPYSLTKNAGNNTLHGGVCGFDKRLWTLLETHLTEDKASLTFKLFSRDGDQGFPGNVEASVTFTLDNENVFTITYKAITDRRTPFSMTHHSYFNLTGFKKNILDHEVCVQADYSIPMQNKGCFDENLIPVENTLDDLRQLNRIGALQEKRGRGFETYYWFGDLTKTPHEVAQIRDPESGRSLTISTTEPGMLFYNAIYTSGKLARESGEPYGPYCAFCCETHRCPNGPNLEGAPYCYITPEEPFESCTSFHFKG